ncbi:MAG: FtsW/RodA/SpoVE family cell cycle protein [Clostridia bacterium]|nr:FtsW/RodA/SpoVE family cell cycle protein [Clostridia bacterium]
MRILNSGLLSTLMLLIRFITPFIALFVLWRCYTSFRKGQRRKDPVIMLEDAATGAAFPVLYWENSIGRSKSCDIVIPDESVSRDHAVLLRREEGWFVSDTDSHLGVRVRGRTIKEPTLVQIGDKIGIGPVTLILKNTTDSNIKKRRIFTGFTGEAASPFSLMLGVVLVQLSMTLQLMFGTGEMRVYPLAVFGILFLAEWVLYLFSRRLLRRVSFETETFGLLLSSIGILLISGQGVDAVKMQIAAFLIGIVLFCLIVWFVSDLDRVMKSRTVIAIGALLLFALNLAIGSTVNGSKNWIMLGPVSFQPSEFIKIAFIFVGAATLDRLQTKKNLTVFILFAGACLGCLFIMRDFGTALIFFATFLIIAFMRSGSFRTIFLALAAAFFGVFMILQFRPYVAKRFAGWMHVWEHTQDSLGYQQVRTMTYIASGGLGGLGIGNGCLKYVAASDSDLVFGMLCEEQGLLMGLTVLFGLALLVLYARSDVTRSRSTFYAIASCAAAGMLLFQTCLNVFGPTDILPLTGVTLPLISAGGSSMMSTWGLLAFLKAADERTYAAKRGGRRSAQAEEPEDDPFLDEPAFDPRTKREPVQKARPAERTNRRMEVRIPENELHPETHNTKRKGGVKRR